MYEAPANAEATSPLAVWYVENPDDRWKNIVQLARTKNDER